MATLTQEALDVINRFGTDPGVTADHVRNFYASIAGSPVLVEQFNRAVASGVVKNIDVLTNGNAGAEYDPANDAIRVPLSRLGSPQTLKDWTEITFAVGHEVQHGLNSTGREQMLASFRQDVIERAQSPGPVHDYTDLMRGRLTAHRADEALSHVAGWNALASLIKQANPNATLRDVYVANPGRAQHFVDVGGQPPAVKEKGNLSYSSDLSLAESPGNVEATARNWYDKVPQKLGASGTADYPNFYARSAVSTIVQIERHYNPPTPGVSMPVIGLDMRALKLSEKQLEETGLNFGSNTAPMTYLDMSRSPHTATCFNIRRPRSNMSPRFRKPLRRLKRRKLRLTKNRAIRCTNRLMNWCGRPTATWAGQATVPAIAWRPALPGWPRSTASSASTTWC